MKFTHKLHYNQNQITGLFSMFVLNQYQIAMLKRKAEAQVCEAESSEWTAKAGSAGVATSPLQTPVSGKGSRNLNKTKYKRSTPQTPISNAGSPSGATLTPISTFRFGSSLGLLTKKFINLIKHAEDGVLDLNKAADTLEFAGTSMHELNYIRQAVGFLVIHQKIKKSLEEIKQDLCPALMVRQIYRICTMYWDDKYGTQSVSAEVASIESLISKGRKVVEMEVLTVIELLMNQLIKLDGIIVDRDMKVQRKIQVQRVQKYVETLDVLKVKNATPRSNVAHESSTSSTPYIRYCLSPPPYIDRFQMAMSTLSNPLLSPFPNNPPLKSNRSFEKQFPTVMDINQIREILPLIPIRMAVVQIFQELHYDHDICFKRTISLDEILEAYGF